MDPSPLTRGKLTLTHSLPLPHWLIPAHAGENVHDARLEGDGRGLSPLTRGKPGTDISSIVVFRLIPAHAGKTILAHVPKMRHQAHPRSRGENPVFERTAIRLAGSSPLTRGKRRMLKHGTGTGGLIPAHAGKTTLPTGRASPSWAHPRSRGENRSVLSSPIGRMGSSPLTRGKHFPTCAFTAQIDQILETLELAVSSGSYSVWVACATDAPQDQVRSIGLVLPSSRGAS